MGKRHQAKDVKRLQLRREVIRVLASTSLGAVHGGGTGAGCGRTGDTIENDEGSLCQPSKAAA